jgi:hypothetical protein
MKIIAVAASVPSVMPASAQGCNPWFTFGCYPQQETTWFPAPLPSSHAHRKEHVRHREYHRDKVHEMAVIHAVHPARRLVHHQSHQDSQEEARESITKQVKSFCSRFPNDKACHQEEIERKKEE